MSKFFEDVLKMYLDNNFYEVELLELTQQITDLNLKRSLLMKTKLSKKYEEKDMIHIRNQLWNRLYTNYSLTKSYDWDLMKECIEVLEYSEEFIVETMNVLLENVDSFDNIKAKTDWEYVLSLFDD